jgi:hypothetical protein
LQIQKLLLGTLFLFIYNFNNNFILIIFFENSFGNESLSYTSDSREFQRIGGVVQNVEERTKSNNRIKQMKADLTLANFTLGDEIPEYQSIAHAAMDNAKEMAGEGEFNRIFYQNRLSNKK